jgi:hypothetical protein
VTLTGREPMKNPFDSKLAVEDPQVTWLNATLSLSSGLLEDCERLLHSLEQGEAKCLDSKQSFDLFSSLGKLRYSNWRRSYVPREESERIENGSARLYHRLSLLKNRSGVLRLDDGIAEILNEIEKESHNGDRRYRNMAYDDMESSLMWYLDRLGYALGITKEIDFPLSPILTDRIERNYQLVKVVLPRLMEKFRTENDFPEFIEGSFPESFWWRQWNRYTTHEAILKALMKQ